MPYKWTEKAPEGELFEDAYGTCGKKIGRAHV